MKLYTHNGSAHADEVFACAILSIIYPESEIIRTRDEELIESVKYRPDSFLLDIGLTYDPDNLLFDHHQTEGAGYRDASSQRWPYATAGLVWKHFGNKAILALFPDLDEAAVKETHNFIDLAILRYIDAADCGVRMKSSGPTLSSLISSFNSSRGGKAGDSFYLVKSLSQEILINYINRKVIKIKARNKVRAGTLNFNGELLVLDASVPWADVVINEMPSVKLVAYPVGDRKNPQWQLRAAVDEHRQPRIKLPKSWGGLDRNRLASVSGVSSALFCHRARHLAGAGEFNCILTMAKKALEAQDKSKSVSVN